MQDEEFMDNRATITNVKEASSLKTINDAISVEILLNCFSFLDLKSNARVSSVCTLWNNINKEHTWVYRFKQLFPDLYKLYNQIEYRNLMQSIDQPVNYFNKLQEILIPLCGELNKEQFQDYLILRSCNLEGIKKILACGDGQKRIFLADRKGNHIFDFLRNLEKSKRQEILDNIFQCLSNPFIKNGVWDFTRYEIKNFQDEYGIPISSIMPNGLINPILLVVFASLCNQSHLIQTWIDDKKIGFSDLECILSIALHFNYDDLFKIIEPHMKNMDDNVFGFELGDILTRIIGRTNANFSLSPDFANKIFALICKSNQFLNELFPTKTNELFRNAGLLFFATLLNQQDFINEKLKVLPDINIKSDCYYNIAFNRLTTNNFGGHLNLDSNYRHKFIKLLENKGLNLISCFDGYQKNWCCGISFHPFYPFVSMNDLCTIYNLCMNNYGNEKLKQYILEASAYDGNLDCFQLMISLDAAVDEEKIMQLLEANKKSLYIKKQFSILIDLARDKNYSDNCSII